MQDIKKVLGWVFACMSLLHVWISLRSMYLISRHYASFTLRNLFFAVLFHVVVATICGVAWWTIWKGKPSARVWGIAASLVMILVFFQPLIYPLGRPWWSYLSALAIGIMGLIEFLRHKESSHEISA